MTFSAEGRGKHENPLKQAVDLAVDFNPMSYTFITSCKHTERASSNF